jgi:hypothetical protein
MAAAARTIKRSAINLTLRSIGCDGREVYVP